MVAVASDAEVPPAVPAGQWPKQEARVAAGELRVAGQAELRSECGSEDDCPAQHEARDDQERRPVERAEPFERRRATADRGLSERRHPVRVVPAGTEGNPPEVPVRAGLLPAAAGPAAPAPRAAAPRAAGPDRPVQERPSQVLPLQFTVVHERPVHERPVQDRPSHAVPVQPLPVQVLPFQTPPVQLRPSASRVAIATSRNAGRRCPARRSARCRPWRRGRSRALSSEPVPVASREVLHVAPGSGVARRLTSSDLAGALGLRVASQEPVGAVGRAKRFTWSGVRLGYLSAGSGRLRRRRWRWPARCRCRGSSGRREQAFGVVLVDVRAGDAQALEVRADRRTKSGFLQCAPAAGRAGRSRRRSCRRRSSPCRSCRAPPTAITYGIVGRIGEPGACRRAGSRCCLPRRRRRSGLPGPLRGEGERVDQVAFWVELVPYERLSTRMFMPLSLRCCTTQSMAAITW